MVLSEHGRRWHRHSLDKPPYLVIFNSARSTNPVLLCYGIWTSRRCPQGHDTRMTVSHWTPVGLADAYMTLQLSAASSTLASASVSTTTTTTTTRAVGRLAHQRLAATTSSAASTTAAIACAPLRLGHVRLDFVGSWPLRSFDILLLVCLPACAWSCEPRPV